MQKGEKGGSLINNYVGKRGEEKWIRLVLKSIADVGLVGFVFLSFPFVCMFVKY